MKALISVAAGGPETLVFRDMPEPNFGPSEVLVRVKACGINFPDGLLIRDKYQIRPPRPFSPGSEISGVVEAVGSAVTRFAPGDHVLARLGWGGLAQTVAVAQERCLIIDKTMPFDEAAAFIFAYGTAYHALVDRGTLKPGDVVLVLGAAGGVGMAAVGIAKALGATVVAAASSAEKRDVAIAGGADRGVVYPRDMLTTDQSRDLALAFKEACGAAGADIVVDPVGGAYTEPALRTTARNGRYLVIGFVAGIPSIPLQSALAEGQQYHWRRVGIIRQEQPGCSGRTGCGFARPLSRKED